MADFHYAKDVAYPPSTWTHTHPILLKWPVLPCSPVAETHLAFFVLFLLEGLMVFIYHPWDKPFFNYLFPDGSLE